MGPVAGKPIVGNYMLDGLDVPKIDMEPLRKQEKSYS
jgi:hypothetical protein